MPLVPTNTYLRWYRTDSWVYRQFAYLFQNPLWKTKIPGGCSLCPLFWLALFSFTFFRLLVGLCVLLKMSFKFFRVEDGWHKANKVCCRLFKKLIPSSQLPEEVSFLMAIILGFVATLVGVLVVQKFAEWWQLAGETKMVDGTVIESFRALLVIDWVLWAVVAATVWYSFRPQPRCRVEGYAVLCAVLALVSAVCLFPGLATEIVVGWPVFLLKFVGHGIAVAAAWVWGGIAAAAVWTWDVICAFPRFLWQMIVANTILAISVAFVAVVGLLVTRFAPQLAEDTVATSPAPNRTEEEELRAARMSLFATSLREADLAPYHEFRGQKFWESYVWKLGDVFGDIAKVPEQQLFTRFFEVRYEAYARANAEYGASWERKRKMNIACSAFTEAVHKILVPLGNALATGLLAICKVIGAIFVGLWAVITYLAALVVAKKKGACPYRRFENV